jgi:glycerol-3-phosphate acyltransferase PlsY
VGAASAVILCIAMNRFDYRIIISSGLALMVAIRHRENLARMYEGRERRIDQRIGSIRASFGE